MHIRIKDRIADAERFYSFGDEIGEGGNARVFRATDRATGREVVVKVLKSEDTEKIQRFLAEIDVMMANQAVPGIVPVLRESHSHHWYAMPPLMPIMEWAENLKNSLPRSPYNWDELERAPWLSAVVDRFIEISQTLASLHAAGVYHRDLKPDNLYFDGRRALIGDFGLVEFPNNPNNFTRDDKGLGAIFSIAPEMKRNPNEADASKADVYSLAKSLWMVLMGNEKGFEGQYQWNEPLHGLRFNAFLEGLFLADLEVLLYKSTGNDPKDRPSMKDFLDGLLRWKDLSLIPTECDNREWNFIQARIFGGLTPASAELNDPVQIVSALNVLSHSSALNHMMFSRGGLDFTGAELVNEPGFIYIYCDGFINLLKPRALYLETFEDPRWNYYLLEAEEVDPIPDIYVSQCGEQELIEDKPAHYVDASCWVYKVYDYDSGIPLPPGAKLVTRYSKGKFLIVMKSGPYNHIQQTYDGRHACMSNEELKAYIGNLHMGLERIKAQGFNEDEILNSRDFSAHPFPERDDMYRDFYHEKPQEKLPDPKSFIENNFENWDFSHILPADKGNGKLAFSFEFNPEFGFSSLLSPRWVLDCEGRIRELNPDVVPFEVYDRAVALNFLDTLNKAIVEKCNGFDVSVLEHFSCFSLKWRRIAPPSHLFTREELFTALRNADDRLGNVLVIDEEGFAHVLPNDGTVASDSYPVVHESFGAYHNYVGKYSYVGSYEQHYIDSLACWRDHLRTGLRIYCDLNRYESESSLLSDIQQAIDSL